MKICFLVCYINVNVPLFFLLNYVCWWGLCSRLWILLWVLLQQLASLNSFAFLIAVEWWGKGPGELPFPGRTPSSCCHRGLEHSHGLWDLPHCLHGREDQVNNLTGSKVLTRTVLKEKSSRLGKKKKQTVLTPQEQIAWERRQTTITLLILAFASWQMLDTYAKPLCNRVPIWDQISGSSEKYNSTDPLWQLGSLC